MNYKNYLLRQLGLKPITIKEDHLKMVDQPDVEEPSSLLKKLVSPVVAIAVRGAPSGGLPAGGVVKNPERAKLGGLEPVSKEKPNSQGTIAKTPINSTINGPQAVNNSETPIPETPHPHQIQKNSGEPPQSVTGAQVNSDGGDTSNVACPDNVEPEDVSIKVDEEYPKDLKKGELHKNLGVPKDQKIPTSRLEQLAKSLTSKREKMGSLSEKEQHLSKMIHGALNSRKAKGLNEFDEPGDEAYQKSKAIEATNLDDLVKRFVGVKDSDDKPEDVAHAVLKAAKKKGIAASDFEGVLSKVHNAWKNVNKEHLGY